MSDITASERRLSAALDRLDQLLEAGARPVTDPQQIARLTRERDDALARATATPGDDGTALADLQARLEAATEQAARISAANEDLMAANRDLLEAHETGGIGPDESRAALEAEIAALRAARAAEMAQMSEIMTELERLLAEDPELAEGDGPLSAQAVAEAVGDGLDDAADEGAQPPRDGQDAVARHPTIDASATPKEER